MAPNVILQGKPEKQKSEYVYYNIVLLGNN